MSRLLDVGSDRFIKVTQHVAVCAFVLLILGSVNLPAERETRQRARNRVTQADGGLIWTNSRCSVPDQKKWVIPRNEGA